MLEFEEHDESGHLHAEGIKGQYWILDVDLAWTYLQRVNIDAAGANVEKLGTFNSIEDAIEEANTLDLHTEEED